MDNLDTYKPGSLHEAFPPEEAKWIWDRVGFVHAPKHGNWLNNAEIEINVLIHQCQDPRIDGIAIVRSAVAAWQWLLGSPSR